MEEINIEILDTISRCNKRWDSLGATVFMKKEFLKHLEQTNYCDQTYYEYYVNEKLVAATLVYSLKIDLFTFSNLSLPIKVRIVGIPASVAAPPIIGDPNYFNELLKEILKNERGLILGLNFLESHLEEQVVDMNTLPTLIASVPDQSFVNYLQRMRHPYRRRVKKSIALFNTVKTKIEPCSAFTEHHYALYRAIMERTSTKLEILSIPFFQNLPPAFKLTSHYFDTKLIAWQITVKDDTILYFLFGGLNYDYRDRFNSYFNNIISIVDIAVRNGANVIDFGQTAELSKMRLGAIRENRKMFFFHKNVVIRTLLKAFKPLISYSSKTQQPHVFKSALA